MNKAQILHSITLMNKIGSKSILLATVLLLLPAISSAQVNVMSSSSSNNNSNTSASVSASTTNTVPNSDGTTSGSYMPTGRSNDVFLFCKQGVPSDGWVSTNPATGSYRITRRRPDLRWIPTFQEICPKGGPNPGVWSGPGDGSQVPFAH